MPLGSNHLLDFTQRRYHQVSLISRAAFSVHGMASHDLTVRYQPHHIILKIIVVQNIVIKMICSSL